MTGCDESSDNGIDTRQRVLQAAAAVFSEKGFEKATVREIVERAGANVNAVNYYFKGKRELFLALLDDAHTRMAERDRQEFARIRELPNEERLRSLIVYVLHMFLEMKNTEWRTWMMHRELIEPTSMLDMMVERIAKPRFAEFADVVRRMAGEEIPDFKVSLCAESIIAQCVHIIHGRAIVSAMIPGLKYDVEGMELLAEHITEFSVAAIKALKTSKG